ncbi:SRPBCC domain-containing protein [Rhodoplanes elegans]|nr:SRPBCC domain-containing protein [Rhodoplanes elegans]
MTDATRTDSSVKTIGALQVTPRGDDAVVLTRMFAAPPERVFQGWSDPDLMRRWLAGPPGWSLVTCEIEPRVGGVYRLGWRGPDGTEMRLDGVYRALESGRRIVGVERFAMGICAGDPGDVEVTLTFTPVDGGTRLGMAMRYASKEARDGALASPMPDGVAGNLERLAGLLASGRDGDRSPADQSRGGVAPA